MLLEIIITVITFEVRRYSLLLPAYLMIYRFLQSVN